MTLCKGRMGDDDTSCANTSLPEASQAEVLQTRRPRSWCRFTFVLLGTLLICAAGFKVHQASREPMLESQLVTTVALICF